VSLLHYPKTFTEISPLIAILAINMPLVAVDMVLGTVLIALGKQKSWTLVGVVACVANPLVNLWAIPFTQHVFGDGAIGASITTVQSEVIMFVGALILRPKGVFTGWDVWYIFRCLLAAGLMIPAVWGLSTQAGVGILPAVCYGIVVYALAVYALQVVRNGDFKALVVVIGARLGLNDASQLNWRTLRAQLGLDARVANTRGALARTRGVISRPLGVVSRPLARAGSAVSQPLTSARHNVVSVLREQYHASPVSQYIQKAGEIFSQEAIPDGNTEPALIAISPDGMPPSALGAEHTAPEAVTEEVPVVAEPFAMQALPALAAESAAVQSDGATGDGAAQDRRRAAPQPTGRTSRKDPRTLQRGETEPLPSLEEVQNRAVPASARRS
ncbi:MAG: polysaccharide biosynthesis C-terminal domain-containing protein, partial [Ktedonobacterales bacterium]